MTLLVLLLNCHGHPFVGLRTRLAMLHCTLLRWLVPVVPHAGLVLLHFLEMEVFDVSLQLALLLPLVSDLFLQLDYFTFQLISLSLAHRGSHCAFSLSHEKPVVLISQMGERIIRGLTRS